MIAGVLSEQHKIHWLLAENFKKSSLETAHVLGKRVAVHWNNCPISFKSMK